MQMTKAAEQDQLVQAGTEEDPVHGGSLHRDPTPVPKTIVSRTGQKFGSAIRSS